MEKCTKNLKTHLFICTSCTYTKSDNSSSCDEEAVLLRKKIKNYAKEKYGKETIKVSAVHCLGECENGIASVFYPQNEWNLKLALENEEYLTNRIDFIIKN
jgi:predicted metal-binding protein